MKGQPVYEYFVAEQATKGPDGEWYLWVGGEIEYMVPPGGQVEEVR